MSTAAPAAHAPPRAGFGPGRIVLIVLGALLAAIGLGLVAGGGAIAWANETQRDDSGWLALGLVLGGALLVAAAAAMILVAGGRPRRSRVRPDGHGLGRDESATTPSQEVKR